MKILSEEFFHLVIGNHASTVVVEISMYGSLNDIQFFIALNKTEVLARLLLSGDFNRLACHLLEGGLAEIARVGHTTMDKQHGVRDFVGLKNTNLLFIVVYNPLSLFVF